MISKNVVTSFTDLPKSKLGSQVIIAKKEFGIVTIKGKKTIKVAKKVGLKIEYLFYNKKSKISSLGVAKDGSKEYTELSKALAKIR